MLRDTFKVLLKVLQIPFKVLLKVLRKPLKVLLQLFGNTLKVLRNTFKVLLYTCDLVTLHFFWPKLSRINSLCRYTINGEAGWGVSEWQYRNRTPKEELKLNLPRVHADATLESQ